MLTLFFNSILCKFDVWPNLSFLYTVGVKWRWFLLNLFIYQFFNSTPFYPIKYFNIGSEGLIHYEINYFNYTSLSIKSIYLIFS